MEKENKKHYQYLFYNMIYGEIYLIIAWRIPWTEEPGGLQSMELQRVGHNWVTNTFTFQ